MNKAEKISNCQECQTEFWSSDKKLGSFETRFGGYGGQEWKTYLHGDMLHHSVS